jgi:mercuric ion transport protein
MTILSWKQTVVAVPGIGISLLPKLMCPACWPAYAGLVSALGLGFLISSKYLLAMSIVFLASTVGALAFRSSRRHGLGPFWVGLVASAAILIGKFGLGSTHITYSGIGLLMAASVWNSSPRIANISPCQTCVFGC